MQSEKDRALAEKNYALAEKDKALAESRIKQSAIDILQKKIAEMA